MAYKITATAHELCLNQRRMLGINLLPTKLPSDFLFGWTFKGFLNQIFKRVLVMQLKIDRS